MGDPAYRGRLARRGGPTLRVASMRRPYLGAARGWSGRGRGRCQRGRRVGGPGLQGGGWLGEAALSVRMKLKRLPVFGRLAGLGHPRLGCATHFTKRSMSGSQVLNWLVLVMSCWMRCWQTVNAEFESSPEFFSASMRSNKPSSRS